MSNIVTGLSHDLQPLSRRALLKAGVITGVGISTLATVGCGQKPNSDAGAMPSEEAIVFDKLVAIMFPDNSVLFSAREIPITANVHHLLSLIDPGVRADLSVAVKLFEYGALVLGWHFTRFSQLTDDDAIAYVDAWQNGNDLQRGIMSALKKLVYTAYWQDERTWGAVAFDGPVSDKWGLKKLGNAPLPTV